jgi:hypothetical protein
MALLTAKRRMTIERPTLTRSVDAALGCFDGSRRTSSEDAQDVLLALGVIAEDHGASPAIRQLIADALGDVASHSEQVSTRLVVDHLLDLRHALSP